MNFTTVYAGLATTAVVGIAAPVLLPIDLAIKTGFLAAGTACSGILTGLHWSGEARRQLEWQSQQRDSRRRVQQSALTSWELRQTQRHELEDLREVLLMLDDCTPQEQVYFLKKLDLLELLPVYNESRMQREALPAAIDVPARKVEESPFGDERLNWAVDAVVNQSEQSQPQPAIVDDAFPEVILWWIVWCFIKAPLPVILKLPIPSIRRTL